MADGLKLTVSYVGTGFAGSQVQPGARTVQGILDAALAGLFGIEVRTVFAGRTDAGVHAAGQVVSCDDVRPDLAVGVLREAINARLPDDVAVIAVARRPGGFNARYDASWRAYRYRVWQGPPAPLAGRFVWRREANLDVGVMAQAAAALVGERDVAALAGGGEGVPWSERRQRPRGTIRRILRCDVRTQAPWWGPADDGALIEIGVAADGFLPRMVRNIAGELIQVGRGARPIGWMDELLATRDRRAGSPTAPAHGLTLWRVGYDDEVPDGGAAPAA